MKKFFLTLFCLLLVLGGGGYLFKGQLWDFAVEKLTADMFVQSDTSGYSPGLATGADFPAIRVVYQGQTVTSIDSFVHDKGMVFIANRSADW